MLGERLLLVFGRDPAKLFSKPSPKEETSSATGTRVKENHQGDVMLRKCVAKRSGEVQENRKGEE